ncbi:serine hydrolase [Leekyejoonella antrihumi]|uniref:Serine hydrolase n=1 Tax=Leekyejoonella antrihumi TaxID=1660198 RepID=A0A563DXJ5_9MICO|nr:serine hydrolase [Leekyejoonella antrihumi]TWP34980.1 serine hydrolase [Leekyejoonella antrihumi]
MSLRSFESDGTPVLSFQVLDGAGSVLAQRAPDREFYAASTIKLAVLIAAMRAVDAGRLALDQELTATHTFRSAVPGGSEFGMDEDDFDEGMPAEGSPISLHDVLWRMVAVSSNEATNMVVDLVGLDAVAEALAHCGARNSVMQRPIGDVEGRSAGLTNRVTAGDLAALMRAVITGAAASPASTERMVSILEAQQIPYLGKGLPTGTRFGSKSGWVDAIQHDVAFVAPSGDLASPETYVIAVCTRGYEEADATELLAGVSRLAWDLTAH